MGKQDSKGLVARRKKLSVLVKATVIAMASIAVVGIISLTVYRNHQNQQALILAEQQEQEARAEVDRLAAEEEAARLEAERVEQERLAVEEEQAQLEAEAEAEA